MRPIALIALLIGSLRVAAAAAIPAAATAEPFKLVREGLPHDALFDIAMDGASGFAIGSFGAVLATTDGGVSWEAQPALGETALTALALAGERVLIVGQRGAIHRREGRGSFEAVASGTRERLLGVALHRSGLAVAVGGFGTVLVSGDGGLGWQQVALDWESLNEEGLEAHLYDAHINAAGDIFVVGEFGLVLRSRDRGASWEALAGGDASLFALHLAESGHGFAVGQNGTVLHSDDGGESWARLEVGSRANLLDVWASAHGEVVIVGMRALLRSRDGGANWTAATGRGVERSWYQALATGVVNRATHSESPQERLYAVGQMGRIVTLGRPD